MTVSVAALTGWDYFVIAALLISVALGMLRGLVRTVFALAAWIVALIGTPLVRALIIVTIVALVARHLGADREAAWQQALSRPLLDELVSWVTPYLPARSETVKKT